MDEEMSRRLVPCRGDGAVARVMESLCWWKAGESLVSWVWIVDTLRVWNVSDEFICKRQLGYPCLFKVSHDHELEFSWISPLKTEVETQHMVFGFLVCPSSARRTKKQQLLYDVVCPDVTNKCFGTAARINIFIYIFIYIHNIIHSMLYNNITI
jgi:hypothetical protein